MEKNVRTTTCGVVVLIAVLALFSGAGAAGQMQVSMGNVVKLSGYSYSGDTVYLFLTGPNLPTNGVALDNINRLAENGGGTRVNADADGHWVYQWNTGSAGGRLDAGTYTVWVADGPADRSHLSHGRIQHYLCQPFGALPHRRDQRPARPPNRYNQAR